MLMSCKPQDYIGICLKCGNQLSIGYTRAGSPASGLGGTIWRDAYRYMCRNDHKLTLSLTLIKFTYKPLITGLIERAISIAGSGIIFFTLCVVEHNNFYGYVRFRLEAIRGKVIVDIGLGKTVTHRI